jgi:hypothetical protein
MKFCILLLSIASIAEGQKPSLAQAQSRLQRDEIALKRLV